MSYLTKPIFSIEDYAGLYFSRDKRDGTRIFSGKIEVIAEKLLLISLVTIDEDGVISWRPSIASLFALGECQTAQTYFFSSSGELMKFLCPTAEQLPDVVDDTFLVTEEWILASATPGGGYTYAQMRVFGLPTPCTSGWKHRILGRRISLAQKHAFEQAGLVKKKYKPKD